MGCPDQRDIRGGGRRKKLIEVWEWYSDTKRETRHDAARKFGKEIPDAPQLLPENEDAYQLWQNSQTQWRTGGMGIVGLDYPAAFRIAKLLDIEISTCLFSKIKALERNALTKWSRKDGGSNHKNSWSEKTPKGY